MATVEYGTSKHLPVNRNNALVTAVNIKQQEILVI